MATVLTSWKSIAEYMGTGVRTVQRWTAERRFPVRGTGSGHKRLVIATTEEIDKWVRSQSLHGSETDSQSESEILQERIASLQSEIEGLRLHIDVMQMRKELESPPERVEDVLLRSTRLLELSSLLQQERRDILDRYRSTRTMRSSDNPLTLSLLNDPLDKPNTRAGKNGHLGIHPVFLKKHQSGESAVLEARPSPSLEHNPDYPDSDSVAPPPLSAVSSAKNPPPR